MTCELETIWEDVVVGKKWKYYRHLPEGTEEKHENLTQDWQYPS
jgi:hypothetical protein